MIEAFLSWWLRQLLACVPAALRPSGTPDATTATLLPDGSLRLARRRRDRVGATIAAVPADAEPGRLRAALGRRPGPVVLLLPAGTVLHRRVELPLAAARSLGSVLRYEMDRLTPFAAGEVDWTWTVLNRDKARNRVQLDLALVPRPATAAARDALAAAGHPAMALEDGTGTVIPAGGARTAPRRLMAAGVAACAVLALAAVLVPFVRQSLDSRRVEARIAVLRPAVDRADALRRRLASGTAGTDVLAAQVAATGDALSVLALVTTVLPDDTFLSELGWRSRQLTMTGQSAAAPRLIEALSRDPAIRNPVFAAPVTRDDTARVDRFSIRAELTP